MEQNTGTNNAVNHRNIPNFLKKTSIVTHRRKVEICVHDDSKDLPDRGDAGVQKDHSATTALKPRPSLKRPMLASQAKNTQQDIAKSQLNNKLQPKKYQKYAKIVTPPTQTKPAVGNPKHLDSIKQIITSSARPVLAALYTKVNEELQSKPKPLKERRNIAPKKNDVYFAEKPLVTVFSNTRKISERIKHEGNKDVPWKMLSAGKKTTSGMYKGIVGLVGLPQLVMLKQSSRSHYVTR